MNNIKTVNHQVYHLSYPALDLVNNKYIKLTKPFLTLKNNTSLHSLFDNKINYARTHDNMKIGGANSEDNNLFHQKLTPGCLQNKLLT